MNVGFYIIAGMALLMLVLYFILLVTHPKKESRVSSRVMWVISIILFAFVLVISYISQKKLEREIALLREIQSVQLSRETNIAQMTPEQREQLLDSLNKESSQLSGIKKTISNQQSILGNQEPLIQETDRSKLEIEKLKTQIAEYNEILPSSQFPTVKKGFVFSGETSAFVFLPPVGLTEDYVLFTFYFQDKRIIDKIGAIYIDVVRQDSDGKNYQVFSQFYAPQDGINKISVKNYFKTPGVTARLGFFYKTELEKKEYPRFESIHFIPKIPGPTIPKNESPTDTLHSVEGI